MALMVVAWYKTHMYVGFRLLWFKLGTTPVTRKRAPYCWSKAFSKGLESSASPRIAFSSPSCRVKMSRLLVAKDFPKSDSPEKQSENGDNDEDELLDENRFPASTAGGQTGIPFQQRDHQHWRKPGAYVDGINGQQHIKPLFKNPQQLQPHHRLSHSSLIGSCKSMDFCYADERYNWLLV